MKKKPSFIVGIDEVGRGPLAGPVMVGLVCVKKIIYNKHPLFKEVRDSKKLSALAREKLSDQLKKMSKEGLLEYKLSFVSARKIDEWGISKAIAVALKRALSRLRINPLDAQVLLDGSLKAPPQYIHQKTIIGGDDLEPVISAASILAKVARDKKMVNSSRYYTGYGFHLHKGYGTLLHRKAIKSLGLSAVHRKSFCGNIDYRSR